ncbi:hypothetical protein [Paraburkholderia antibiotica]|uniref:hypothetical protein n=1 Tax=Paraburkholderia antibiotica TaxID=2728839 RepID=UPI00197D2517|nr:hypothetical protein [Paraburkholderia antibiotica]
MMESFDEQVDKRRGAPSCVDGWPRRGVVLRARGGEAGVLRRAASSLHRCCLNAD